MKLYSILFLISGIGFISASVIGAAYADITKILPPLIGGIVSFAAYNLTKVPKK